MTDPRTWASPESSMPPDRPVVPMALPMDSDEPIGREIPLRPLGTSEILDGAIATIRRSPRASLGISLILTSVVQGGLTVAEYFIFGVQARSEVTPEVLAQSLGLRFITFVIGLLLTAYVVLLLAGLLGPVMGRTVHPGDVQISYGQAWRDARPALPRLAGAATIVMLAVILAIGLPLAPLILAVILNAPPAVGIIAGVLGVPTAFVLMVTAYVWFALATPVVVLERRGVFAALRRARQLVRGRWWRTLGVLLLALLITAFAGLIVLPIPFAVAESLLLSTSHDPNGWVQLLVVALGGVGRIIAGTLTNPFNAGVIALLYADHRMRREGFDLELGIDADKDADPLTAWLPGPLTAAASEPQPKTPAPPIRPLVMPMPYPPPYQQGPQGPYPQGPNHYGTYLRPPNHQGGQR
jgi:hypothetical protein